MTQEQIGKRLRDIRRLRHVTLVELCDATGWNISLIGGTERGTREMAFHEAVVYARILCFCLNGFSRTAPDGQWDINACLLVYPPKA